MTVPDDAIYNEAGQVAMRYMKQAPSLVRCNGSGTEYVFVVKANISMAYVDEEDVECMLGVKAGCCGGRKKKVIFFADETHHRRWLTGGGR